MVWCIDLGANIPVFPMLCRIYLQGLTFQFLALPGVSSIPFYGHQYIPGHAVALHTIRPCSSNTSSIQSMKQIGSIRLPLFFFAIIATGHRKVLSEGCCYGAAFSNQHWIQSASACQLGGSFIRDARGCSRRHMIGGPGQRWVARVRRRCAGLLLWLTFVLTYQRPAVSL